ncbi:hypothetical protein PAXRUDRAFT_831167 [Paxillus rubicundulus Ve08.2h10]|uniref:Uncharacterized protein n=1 Tax=Paxillus rubicundulus Ve08.2h10 TaxID=930991 RepID=A0A0D0D3K1_9AGAM|nr:hypothetical protein PAXRUDRAFT_831167 [Paxillus rubicundulus Ve08.2h10]
MPQWVVVRSHPRQALQYIETRFLRLSSYTSVARYTGSHAAGSRYSEEYVLEG